MSSSPDDRTPRGGDAAGHFAEAQSELLEGLRSLLKGTGGLGEALSSLSSFGARREEVVRRQALERIRAVLIEERDALADGDAEPRRAFGAVVAVLEREIARLGPSGKGGREDAGRVREVPVE